MSSDEFQTDDEFNTDSEGDGSGNNCEEDDEISPSQQIEGWFMDAEDDRKKKPKECLEIFQKVIDQEDTYMFDKYSFKSYQYRIEIMCKNSMYEDLEKDVKIVFDKKGQKLAENQNKYKRGTNQVLNYIDQIKDEKVKDSLLTLVFETIKESGNDKLLLDVGIRLAEQLCKKKNYNKNKIDELMIQMEQSLKSRGNDRANYELKMYAIKVKIAFDENNQVFLRGVYKKIRHFKLEDMQLNPFSIGILKELKGMMCLLNRQFKDAVVELYATFQIYQDSGNSRAAKLLKYIGIMEICADNKVTTLDNTGAQAYAEHDASAQAIYNVRKAWLAKDIKKFNRLLNDPTTQIQSDSIALLFYDDMVKSCAFRAIIPMIAVYKTITFKFIARQIMQSEEVVERYLSELIVKGKIKGQLNEYDGYFDNEQIMLGQEATDFKSLNDWIGTIQNMR